MFIVIATMLPSVPAAYCRTEYEPFSGGGPGLYVDFSMFCFHVPMSGFGRKTGSCERRSADSTITDTATIRLHFMETSFESQLVIAGSSRWLVGRFDSFY